MIDERIYQQFREIGHDMYSAQLISSHGGNISIRYGDRVIIKRRGAQLGQLKPPDLIETSLDRDDSAVVLASTELIVHKAIYRATSALAVVHAHPRTAVALSLSRDEIVPIDNEASYLLKRVPVVAAEMASGSREMADTVSAALEEYKLIMLRGHGSFAIGQTLDEAFQWTSTLEECCQIILYAKIVNEPFIEYRKMSDSYSRW